MNVRELRVGLIGPLPPPAGGMANQTRQLDRLLREEGIHVEIVQVNAPYRPQWVEPLRGLRALFRLAPYLLRLWDVSARVHLFHVMANSGWSWHLFAAPAVWIARLRGIPVVVNYRGGYAADFLAASLRWVKPTLRLADRLIVPSGFLQEVFGRFGIATDVVPNVIDLTRFGPRSSGAASSGTGPHIVVTRNLEPIYDIATAIHALAHVTKTLPAARLTIAGSGPERDRLASLAESLGLARHVTFTGRLEPERIADLYREADLSLNPSLVDNMPNSLLESLACGVPVVSTDVGGVRFVVEHRKTALLVPAGDAEAMARAVLELTADPRLAAELARAGRESVQQYTWTQIRPRLLELYVGMVHSPRPATAAGAK